MGYLSDFQINQNIAFKHYIIEYQVNEIILGFCADMLLPGNKGRWMG